MYCFFPFFSLSVFRVSKANFLLRFSNFRNDAHSRRTRKKKKKTKKKTTKR